MELCHLGHASWLVRAGGLRILFDPLLDDIHHGGVLEVRPRRTLHAEALEADFIVVSHRHPDHFDVASLRRLAALDADSVVLTSDELVEKAARRVGFRRVARVAARERVELEGVRLLTTPSRAQDPEWGMLIASDDGVVWNQVDTVMRGVDDVRGVLELAASLGRPGLDLALVRWQPLNEVGAALAGDIGFPLREYGELLDQVAATAARTIVPSAAGAAHTAPYAWLNRSVYPVPAARFLRDAAVRCPEASVLPAVVGGVYRMAAGAVTLDPHGARDLVEPHAVPEEPYVPFVIPELVDPNVDDGDEAAMHATIEPWIEGPLPAALARVPTSTLVLEVVYPSSRQAYTFLVANGKVTVERAFDPDWDVLDAIAASQLADVIDGRRHWGEPLLAGLLRAARRGYRVHAHGVEPLGVAPIFLYYALSYEESTERWLDYQLALPSARD
jgi:beta-lactamase family protein